MDDIKALCKTVRPEMRDQVETLVDAVLALQKKIEKQLPVFEQLPLAQTLTTVQGEKALKNNPALQEFRATVRDYAQALAALKNIVDANRENNSVTSLEDFRKKLGKIAPSAQHGKN